MTLRSLTPGDRPAAERFVAMAALPPWHAPTPEAMRAPRVRRWLDGWPPELGVGCEEGDALVGAAWARVTEPSLWTLDGTPLPELVIAVEEARRGTGIGRQLLRGLQELVLRGGAPGLVLTAGRRNTAALRLYGGCGFTDRGDSARGQALMVWLGQE